MFRFPSTKGSSHWKWWWKLYWHSGWCCSRFNVVSCAFNRRYLMVERLLKAQESDGKRVNEKDEESMRAMKKHYALTDQNRSTDGTFTSSSTSSANASDLYPLKLDAA
ncbi:hypothetical protein Bca52824_025351 [Brassica carinata]|uniref:Uncharacterized protein n=1 Tax=Brassica carinata TaxID=52824 RepID=A0A8X7SE46_BRACI|nr:hypothetical protein Bca52824_025351 [Brassica carinata]